MSIYIYIYSIKYISIISNFYLSASRAFSPLGIGTIEFCDDGTELNMDGNTI